MRSNLWLAASLVAALAGCGGSGPPRGDIWYGSTTLPNVSANFVYRVKPGAGIDGVVPGQNVGYYVTGNAGGSFRLVWTGDYDVTGRTRRMQGSVWTAGAFTSEVIGCAGGFCRPAKDNLVSTIKTLNGPGQRIDWDSVSTNGLEGFDFVADNVPVYFQLRVDGADRADLTYFPATDNGGVVSNAGGMPFGLIPQ